MDVYFERIAGVGEAKGANARRPMVPGQAADPARLELVDDGHVADPGAEVPLDDMGFPLSPLRDQDELWFVQAAHLYRPLEKCARTARASGSFMLVSGIVTLLFAGISAAFGGLQENLVTLVIGLILATLGIIERSAGNDIAQCKVSAPSRLAWNQLMVFGVIALYCGLQMKGFASDPSAAALSPEVQESLASTPQFAGIADSVSSLDTMIVYSFFGFVVVTSLLFQGGMAMYYLSRRKRIQRFHQELPPWVSRIVLTVAEG
ncbi:MAG: hypothetical protein H6825_07800 [Planctomycetes bacterium]|nr:hypothetical protein [Planctomycetota bacterium]